MAYSNAVRILSIIAVSYATSACGNAKFTATDALNASSDAPINHDDPENPVTPETPAICDPFDPSNTVSATSGLKASMYYLEPNQEASSSTDLISKGKRVDVDVFLNRLFVPTREFTAGFTTSNNTPIKDGSNRVLIEWFALKAESKLKLGAADTEGEYQFAIISDDGATLKVQNGNGGFETVVDNDGQHHTQMGCAAKTVKLNAQSRLPMSLTYYQGPRTYIAMTLMWRKVPTGAGSADLAENECGKGGNDYFFNSATATVEATPKAPYRRLLDAGWKPLSADNFELQSGTNRCAIK